MACLVVHELTEKGIEDPRPDVGIIAVRASYYSKESGQRRFVGLGNVPDDYAALIAWLRVKYDVEEESEGPTLTAREILEELKEFEYEY